MPFSKEECLTTRKRREQRGHERDVQEGETGSVSSRRLTMKGRRRVDAFTGLREVWHVYWPK